MSPVAWATAFALAAEPTVPPKVPAPMYDPRCREPTQFRHGTPRRTCAFNRDTLWPQRRRALSELRIANWTMITGAGIFTIGLGILIGGLASNRADAPRGDDPLLPAIGGGLMGAGGFLVLLGGIWRLAVDRPHR